ncbi:MAG: hypothetical protein GQ582_06855, partial [Methyloprofundus sp.]|nr:hypothetical protein [Methyloprofundus sp.]
MSGSYERFEAAYSILHLVLAGDFFNEHEKYLKAVDLLKDLNNMAKYKNLIEHPVQTDLSTPCR